MRLRRANSTQEWDSYWEKVGCNSKGFYRVVTGFYRNKFLEPYLWWVSSRHLQKGARLLHAGSGGGEVDLRMLNSFKITAIDISKTAIDNYRNLHKEKAVAIEGSILSLPFEDGEFDCVYNLGVMEHFSPEEIGTALKEFYRILRSGGKVMLFWPPRFGLSVMVFKVIHFVLNNILGRKIRLHPDEPGLLNYRREADTVLKEAGFKVEASYFGWRDLFSQVAVVGVKLL